MNIQSYSEKLASQVIDWLNGESESMVVVNQDYTYQVNTILQNKGYLNYSFVVYHGRPSPNPHFTLNTHKEDAVSVEMFDISQEQAEALRDGTMNFHEARAALTSPLPTYVIYNGEIVNVNK